MISVARTDNSIVGRWWWTVDRWLLLMIAALAFCGAVLALAASPAVAERIGLDTYYFATRQLIYLPTAMIVMLGVSLLNARGVRRLALMITTGAIILMVLTLVVGVEVKGATRWFRLGGFTIQASEFVKPGFTILAAWLFSQRRLDDRFPGYVLATTLYLLIAALLVFATRCWHDVGGLSSLGRAVLSGGITIDVGGGLGGRCSWLAVWALTLLLIMYRSALTGSWIQQAARVIKSRVHLKPYAMAVCLVVDPAKVALRKYCPMPMPISSWLLRVRNSA